GSSPSARETFSATRRRPRSTSSARNTRANAPRPSSPRSRNPEITSPGRSDDGPSAGPTDHPPPAFSRPSEAGSKLREGPGAAPALIRLSRTAPESPAASGPGSSWKSRNGAVIRSDSGTFSAAAEGAGGRPDETGGGGANSGSPASSSR